ncbi:MAG: dTDP-4-dehydrorhamnose reductase [Rhizobiaceae bacterium]|nr:dTDP-4-dehydrorhamnose reductase [Rhizobiaceae bacterium]MCV0408142.1 dTDP-4-dehydrorhamnose reductase [Rhizobiaceae bacterium]
MRILVTGKAGQVALSLKERAASRPDMEVTALGRPELDLEKPATVGEAIRQARPDLVVSAAAYTAVDKAEDEPDLARAVNVDGAEAVAAAAAAAGAPVIHLSTDYVYSGELDRPWREDDATAPLGVYGRTKLDGEAAVAAANPRHLILRTAWVYSPFGRNFVRTMLMLAEQRDTVNVVADQIGNPTSALDIADAVLALAARGDGPPGVYHLAGSGEASWAEVAKHVFAVSAAEGGPSAAVTPIRTDEYPTKARRPANSRLDQAKMRATFGWVSPDWRESVAVVVKRLLAEGGQDRP